MSTERIERLSELARRLEQIDAEWRLLDARRRDRSPTLIQLRSLYDWVQDKERDFSERFPEVAGATQLPDAPDPDDLPSESLDGRAWAALEARRALLEEEWERILAGWEQLAADWQALLERRRATLESSDTDVTKVREQLLARERAISSAIAGVFQPGPAPSSRPATNPLFSSPTDGGAARREPVTPPVEPPPAEPGPPPGDATGPGARGAARVALGVPINLRVEHRLLAGSTENVSLTGVFVRTDAMLPVGRELDLVFDLPERKGLQAVGRVMWQRPAQADGGQGVGVHFDVLPDETRRALEAFARRTGRALTAEGTW
jgi:uncharacterized protein (TIGR02266 family)